MKQNYELQIRDASERMTAIAAELGRMGVGIDSGLTNKDFEPAAACLRGGNGAGL